MSYDWGKTEHNMTKPYAWVDGNSRIQRYQIDPLVDIPLYTKQEWKGLTDGEIHDCFQNRGRGRDGLKTRKMIATAIEAMLREKNGG